MLNDLVDKAPPIVLTIIAAWMTFEVIGLVWLAREFRRDMRREDEEATANRKGNR